MMWFLALRNVILSRKRYTLMAIAIAIGFTLITVLTGLSNGAFVTIRNKSARYFSGQVCVIGLTGWDAGIAKPQPVIETIKKSGLPIVNISPRSVYYGSYAGIFFGGKYLRLKRPIGVDFSAEKKQLEKLPFVAGGIAPMLDAKNKNGIIIGKPVADVLKARIGDDIVLSIITDSGQYNTVTLIVQGIYDEVSVFGYAAYMDIAVLNELMQVPAGFATEIAVYTKNTVELTSFTEKLRQYLAKTYPVYPPLLSRAVYAETRGDLTEHPETLALVSISAQLDEINSLLNAFLILTYFVLAVFLLIITAGITSTFRVLVYDRTKEIGTLRVLGMHKKEVRNLFLMEASILAVCSSLFGLFAAFVILNAVGVFNLQEISAINMFIENGRLQFQISMQQFLLNMFFILITVFFAVARPAWHASSIPPAEALRQQL